MQEVVSTFIVGHWASSRVVGNSHVNYSVSPPNLIEVKEGKVGDEYPTSFYEKLACWFSKDGDTVLEIGHGHDVGNVIYLLFYFLMYLNI